MKGKNIFSVRRRDKKRGIFQDDISSDGRSYILIEYDSRDSGHVQEFDADQSEEFFRKFLKNKYPDELLKKHARELFKHLFGVREKSIRKIDEQGTIPHIFYLLKDIVHGKKS